jgi:hypothetical protein
VLDESGETPPEEAPEPKEDKKADAKKSTVDKYQRPNHLAKAKRSRYDRMYIDINRDGDLTNDPVVRPMKSPPWDALPTYWEAAEKMAFDFLDLDVDYGPGVGVRPFRVLPWLTLDGSRDRPISTMHFVPATAREGRIRIGLHEYDALLSMWGNFGRWDCPSTSLKLKPVKPQDRINYGGFSGYSLMSAHRVDGKIYTTRATPLGDQLIVEPYRGDVGVLIVGPGGRNVKKITVNGSLRSETMEIDLSPNSTTKEILSGVIKGLNAYLKPDPPATKDKQDPSQRFFVPVGDYVPSYLNIAYDNIHFSLSNNYHSEGKPQNTDRDPAYFIAIRKDKPFVLDFSAKPDVMFAEPAKDKKFKPGDNVTVKAVLVDPAHDVMIRGLTDASRNQKQTYRTPDGKEISYEALLSLDPVVTVVDSSGKKIAEGTMPFG